MSTGGECVNKLYKVALYSRPADNPGDRWYLRGQRTLEGDSPWALSMDAGEFLLNEIEAEERSCEEQSEPIAAENYSTARTLEGGET